MASDGSGILVAMALPAESAGVFQAAGVEVLYTGVGKVNAAIALTRRIARLRREGHGPPLVVNFGTAGSARIPARTLVACRRFVDRDMDVGALGFAPGVTPFDELPPMLEFPALFAGLPEAVCGSGDSFATADHGPACDVVDMEAYALAKACRIEGAAIRLREVRERRRRRERGPALEGERGGRRRPLPRALPGTRQPDRREPRLTAI